MILQLWGSICTSNCLRNAPLAPSVAFGRHDGQNHDFWPKSLPKKARPGTGKQHGLASSRTPFFDLRWNDLQCQTLRPEPIKKEDFAAVGLNLHLQLPSKCTVGTFRCVWASRPKSLPKKARPGTGKQHGLASSRTPFFDLRWNDLQCQTLRPEPIKKDDFAAVGLNLHLQLPSKCTVGTFRCVWASRRRNFWPKSLPKKARPGTGKQHGLASSRTPCFDLRWNDLQCQTLRPEPLKKENFAAARLNLHLQLPSECTVGTFRCVWASRRAKPRLLTQKPSQKGSPRNGETAWPGELKDTVLRPALEWSSMSNVASRTYKKRGLYSFGAQFAPPIAFEMHRWHLPLRLGVTTGKTTTSDPKAFPKRLARERMAWRAQGHRFSTCVGMIFNVKRCVQNL